MKEFYCCGKLSNTSLAFTQYDKSTCDKGDSENDKCCKNKFQYFKIKDDHVGSIGIKSINNYSIEVDHYYPVFAYVLAAADNANNPYQSNAPPPYNDVPVYLSNCSFLI